MAGFGTQPFGSSAFGGTNPSGAVASTPKVRDTVTGRKHAARGISSTPKVRDVVTGTPDRGATILSTPKVRDTVTAAVGDRAAAAIASIITVADSVVGLLPTTRIYLPSAGAAPISPAYAAEWDDTTNAATRLLAQRTPSGSTPATISAAETGGSTADSRDLLIRQYTTDPLTAQTISGTIRAQIQARESNAAANMRGQMIVRVVSNDGGTVRGTLYAGDLRTAVAAEWTTVLRSQRVPGFGSFPPPDMTPVVVQAGDRIVIELGARAQNVSAVNYSGEYRFGDNAATDLALGGVETADLNPWVELSSVLAWAATTTIHAITSRVAVLDTVTSLKHSASGALSTSPKVRDTVVSVARRARAIASRVTAADTVTVRKHALVAAFSSTPKVRDTVTGIRHAAVAAVASTPKVRDIATARKHSASGALSTAPKVRDTATARKHSVSGVLPTSAPKVRDTVTGIARRLQPAAVQSTVTVADTATGDRTSRVAALATSVVVADVVVMGEATRSGSLPTTRTLVTSTLAGATRPDGTVITNVFVRDTVTASTVLGGFAYSSIVVYGIISSAAVNRIPADITSTVHVTDDVDVAAETFRDITVTATLETVTMFRGSREFIRVQFVADVELGSQAVELQLTQTRISRPNRHRRVALPVDSAWEEAEWVGPAGTTRRVHLLYDAGGRATKPGVYAVHARLHDRPELLVFINVGLLSIT